MKVDAAALKEVAEELGLKPNVLWVKSGSTSGNTTQFRAVTLAP